MKMISKIVTLVFLLSITLYANAVGTITAISGKASIIREAQTIEATLGAKLQEKDTIKTADDTKVQLIFNDETVISIGKNSNFSINKFLYDGTNTPSAKFGLLRGAMRTITGKIGKIAPDRFSVKTKTATIGIRGTNFSIFASANGSAKVFCTFGAISVSTQDASINSIVNQGFYIQVSPAGVRSQPIKFTPQELKKIRKESFQSNSKVKKIIEKTLKNSNINGKKIVQKSVAAVLTADSPIDISNTEDLSLLVKNITKTTSQSVQTNTVDIAEEIEKAPEDAAVAVADTFDVAGLAVWSLEDSNQGTIALKTIDSRTLDTTYSKIIIGGWTLTPASSISGTVDDFTGGTFSGAAHADYDNINITSSSFKATTDLSSSDDMTWGEWNANIDYDDAGGYPDTATLSGLWVAGENPTPTNVIDGYMTNNDTATYTGNYKAIDTSSSDISSGDATLTIDFGASSGGAHLDIGTNGDVAKYTGDVITSGITFSQIGGQSGDQPGHAVGKFYGSEGKSVAGSFNLINNSDYVATKQGVYEVTTDSITPQ